MPYLHRKNVPNSRRSAAIRSLLSIGLFLAALTGFVWHSRSSAGPGGNVAPVLEATLQAGAPAQANTSGPELRLPLEAKSVRFAVIGDSGTGEREQYDVAKQIEIYRQKVGFEFVIMLGDNIYGNHSPKDFES